MAVFLGLFIFFRYLIFPEPSRDARWIVVLVLLALAVYALEAEHSVVTPDGQTLAKHLEGACG